MSASLARIAARRRPGFSLLEMGLALVIAGLTLATMTSISNTAVHQVVASGAGDRLQEVQQAAQAYLAGNAQQIAASVPVGGKTEISVGRTSATSSAPSGSLQALGYLPTNFVDANAYGQHTIVVFSQATAGNVDMLVETVGGRAIPDSELSTVAQKVSAAGGFIQHTSPSDAENEHHARLIRFLRRTLAPPPTPNRDVRVGPEPIASAIFELSSPSWETTTWPPASRVVETGTDATTGCPTWALHCGRGGARRHSRSCLHQLVVSFLRRILVDGNRRSVPTAFGNLGRCAYSDTGLQSRTRQNRQMALFSLASCVAEPVEASWRRVR